MSRVLLIQADGGTARSLTQALASYGHRLRWRPTGLSGLKSVLDETPDVVLLDLALPDVDALRVLAMLRAVSSVPVIAVTAREGEADGAHAVGRGADDYVVRPCGPDRLDAKIRSVLRQQPHLQDEGPVAVADLTVHPRARTVTLSGATIRLSRMEFDLLLALARRPGRVLTRTELRQALWPGRPSPPDRSLEVLLWSLRSKLGESGRRPRYVHTVPRVGVMLRDPGQHER